MAGFVLKMTVLTLLGGWVCVDGKEASGDVDNVRRRVASLKHPIPCPEYGNSAMSGLKGWFLGVGGFQVNSTRRALN